MSPSLRCRDLRSVAQVGDELSVGPGVVSTEVRDLARPTSADLASAAGAAGVPGGPTNPFGSRRFIDAVCHVVDVPVRVLEVTDGGGVVRGRLMLTSARRGMSRVTHLGIPLADYSSFAVDPDHRDEVVAALGAALAKDRSWDVLVTGHAPDPSVHEIAHIAAAATPVRTERQAVGCPILELPGTREEYLDSMSSKLRGNIRRSQRRLVELPGYRLTTESDADFPEALAMLLESWRQRWDLPGAHYQALFEHLAAAGTLWCRVDRTDGRFVSGLVGVVDREGATFSYCLSSYDPEFNHLSPGLLSVVRAIDWSIDEHLRWFDFLRGEEDYKARLGATPRRVESTTVTRRTWRSIVASYGFRVRSGLSQLRSLVSRSGRR